MSRRPNFSNTPYRPKPRGDRDYSHLERQLHRQSGTALEAPAVTEAVQPVLSAKAQGRLVPNDERLEFGRLLSMPGLLPVDMIGRALQAIKHRIVVSGDPRRERLAYVGSHELYPDGYEVSPNAYAIMHRTEHALSRTALYSQVSVPLNGVEIVPQEKGIQADQRIIKGAVWLAFDGSPLEAERRTVRELAELKVGSALRRVRVATIEGPKDMLADKDFISRAAAELTYQLPSQGTVYGLDVMESPYDPGWKPVYPHPRHPDVQREHVREERDRQFLREMPDWVRTMLEEQST